MASNPVPLLSSLGGSIAQQKDVEALKVFLQLLREQIGGDSAFDNISEQVTENQTNIAINANNIADNTASILTNAANIATNTSDIADIQADLTALDKEIYARIALRI